MKPDNALTPERYEALRAAKLGTVAKIDPIDQLKVALATKRADMKLRPHPAPQIDPVAAVQPLALADDAARREAERQARTQTIAAEQKAAEGQQDAARWQRRAELLDGFPPRAVADLDGFEAAIVASDRFKRLSLATRYGGLIGLRGLPGTGKTTEACALARWYVQTFQRHAVYAKADDYIGAYRHSTQGYGARMHQAKWIEDRTRHDGLLVLDELDKVPGLYGDNFTAKQHGFWLEAILDSRYAARNRPTVLCANFDDDGWALHVPPATRDRFKSDGVIFNYAGPSLRRATKENP